MSAAKALRAAHASDVRVTVDGGASSWIQAPIRALIAWGGQS